jgi:hypothetical protein
MNTEISAPETEIDKLRAENAELRKQLDHWKAMHKVAATDRYVYLSKLMELKRLNGGTNDECTIVRLDD